MHTNDSNEIILKAIDAFNRRFLVVSPHFEILACRGRLGNLNKSGVVGRKCYEILYDRTSACQDCPTLEVGRKREPALSPGYLFMNIILNAAQAMEGKGKLTVKTFQSPNMKEVCVEIEDTGPGIPPDILPHIFEPFFTTKEEGDGTGLGLSLAYGIVENHRGHIAARNKPGGGAVFTIKFPIAAGKNNGDQRAKN